MNYCYYAVTIEYEADHDYSIHTHRADADTMYMSWITSGWLTTVAEEEPTAHLAIYRIDTSEPRPWEVDTTWSAWDHIKNGERVAFYALG